MDDYRKGWTDGYVEALQDVIINLKITGETRVFLERIMEIYRGVGHKEKDQFCQS